MAPTESGPRSDIELETLSALGDVQSQPSIAAQPALKWGSQQDAESKSSLQVGEIEITWPLKNLGAIWAISQ